MINELKKFDKSTGDVTDKIFTDITDYLEKLKVTLDVEEGGVVATVYSNKYILVYNVRTNEHPEKQRYLFTFNIIP